MQFHCLLHLVWNWAKPLVNIYQGQKPGFIANTLSHGEKMLGGGLRDDFAVKAWGILNMNPNKPYYKFVGNYKGRKVLRYAMADFMRPSCINCHNTHPQTPKNNWQIGDVRGVLEIVHPMEAIYKKNEKGKFDLFLWACGIGLFGMLSLFFLVRGYQKINKVLSAEVKIQTNELRKSKEDAETVSEELRISNESLLAAKEAAETLQSQLIESNKMASLGAMSSGIAHELSQPLGAILLKTRLIVKLIEKENFEKLKIINEDIKNQALRAKKIMDSLRTFSREDKKMKHEYCNINNIVNDVLTLFLDEFKLLKVNLELLLTKEENTILGSAVQIGQILSNLLVNARDAVENNNSKNIKISTNVIDHNIVLEISDNGYGISKHSIDKVFEPFYTTKPVGKGTGLGLSLSYSMVKDNGGEITISSEEGVGTIFSIIFPVIRKVNDE